MADFIKKALEFFEHDIWQPGHGDFWGGILLSVTLGVFTLFRKRINSFIALVVDIKNQQLDIPKSLKKYQRNLNERTLLLGHSWKNEGQTLKDIFVPVSIFENEKSTRQGLADLINKKFRPGQPVKMLLLGDAGSGKSVAMGYISRQIWEVKRKNFIVPVLMTFSDIKGISTEGGFRAAIAANLERYGFTTKKIDANDFVKRNLSEGNIVLLIDGLDELERSIRLDTADFVNKFFQKYRRVSFILSSRTAVWSQNPNMLPDLNFKFVTMANFSPLEIRDFVSRWNFIGNKSPEQLAKIINLKPYLKAIAVNPLILTIITFLYAQPKRILPDNRVKFYEECIDALMEKWDNAKSIIRANQFETIDKITILNRLAYRHITSSVSTDEEISKRDVLDIISTEMRALSRPVEKREAMLNEIVQNAELLIELPPYSYKFPHRTFMEYFAANYFYEEKNHQELLNLYQSDKGKWQETLALYCGLNVNSEASNEILCKLVDNFVDTENTNNPDTFIFKAFVESARISASLANRLLDIAEHYLQRNINIDIIENLGYIAVNENWRHHERAKQILLNLLARELNEHDLQPVILALVNLRDPDIKDTIIKYLDRINLSDFLLKVGSDADEYAIAVLANISEEKYNVVFDGLKNGGALEFMFNLLIKSSKEELKEYSAWTLAEMSNTKLFLDFTENISLGELDPNVAKKIDFYYVTYGWPKNRPLTVRGRKAIFLICHYCALFIARREKFLKHPDNLVEINYYLKYLISVFLNDSGYRFSEYNLLGLTIEASKIGLYVHWKQANHQTDFGPNTAVVMYVTTYLVFNVAFIFHLSILFGVIIGILYYVSLIIILVFFGEDSEKMRNSKMFRTIVWVIIFTCICTAPIFLLAIQDRLSLTRNRRAPVFCLLYTLLVVIIFAFLPISVEYRYLYTISCCVIGLHLTLTSFINPIGGIFSNFEIMRMLNE